MVLFLCVVAIACMVCGHVLKVYRWGLFISVYERPNVGQLLGSMAMGHTLNTILPIRLGDLWRAFFVGKRLKNSYSFSVATVMADLYVDFVTVSVMLIGLFFIGKGGETLQKVSYIYMLLLLMVIPLSLMCIVLRRTVKIIVYKFAALFNERIEFYLLYITYLFIVSVKDIVRRLNMNKFLIFTVGMWLCYLTSYMVFAEAIQKCGFYYTMSEVFVKLFSGFSFWHIEKELSVLWGAYLLTPLLICAEIGGYLSRKTNAKEEYYQVLPQNKQTDRLAFLKIYYMEENRDYIEAYLQINRDVVVVEDQSAGSNASTLVVMKNDGTMLFRKYAFHKDGEKLQEQIDWIEAHQKDIPLPSILNKRKGESYVAYDMHNYGGAIGLFRYIHTMPVEHSWLILERALDDMKTGLHTKGQGESDKNMILQYITTKVDKNLKTIMKNRYIKNIEKYDVIQVNGKRLHTLKFYKEMFGIEHLMDIFGKGGADVQTFMAT